MLGKIYQNTSRKFQCTHFPPDDSEFSFYKYLCVYNGKNTNTLARIHIYYESFTVEGLLGEYAIEWANLKKVRIGKITVKGYAISIPFISTYF